MRPLTGWRALISAISPYRPGRGGDQRARKAGAVDGRFAAVPRVGVRAFRVLPRDFFALVHGDVVEDVTQAKRPALVAPQPREHVGERLPHGLRYRPGCFLAMLGASRSKTSAALHSRDDDVNDIRAAAIALQHPSCSALALKAGIATLAHVFEHGRLRFKPKLPASGSNRLTLPLRGSRRPGSHPCCGQLVHAVPGHARSSRRVRSRASAST